MSDLKPLGTVNGVVVLEMAEWVSEEIAAAIREHAEERFGCKVALLIGGLKLANLSEERLDRIEAKLDELLKPKQWTVVRADVRPL